MPSFTVADVLDRLRPRIPFERAAGWDPSGLQLGDPADPVTRAGVCHEVTDEVVDAVEADPPELLVTYHPLLFRPGTRLVAGPSPEGRAYRLIRAGVSLAVAHTAFDVAPGGVADCLAAAAGIAEPTGIGSLDPGGTVKVVAFVPPEAVETVAAAMSGAGAGRIGNYTGCSFRAEGIGAFIPEQGANPVKGSAGAPAREPELRLEMIAPAGRVDAVVSALAAAHPYEEPAYDIYEVRANLGFVGRVGDREPITLATLVERLAERLGAGAGLRSSGDPDRVVRRVAVVPGSGSDFLAAARAAGAEVLVTGDVAHHRVVEARDRGLAVIDPGHASTERPGMEALARVVGDAVPALVDLTHLDPTPWR